MTDDMTAFEHQIASEMTGMVGPMPRFDIARIADTATAAAPRWRAQTMLGATTFVVGGVIVALFGGFLVAGALMSQPQDIRPMPAATLSSPLILTTDDALREFQTRAIAPGVARILTDDEHLKEDMAPDAVAFGPDGPWILSDGRLFRLGRPGFHLADALDEPRLASTPGGQVYLYDRSGVWLVEPPMPGEDTTSLADPDGVTRLDADVPAGYEVVFVSPLPDGSVWAGYEGDDEPSRGYRPTLLRRWDGQAWSDHATDEDLAALWDLDTLSDPCAIASDQDGVLWLGVCGLREGMLDLGGFARLVDGHWTAVDPASDLGRPDVRVVNVGRLATGRDGSIWAMALAATDESIAATRAALRAGDDGEEAAAEALFESDPILGPIILRHDGERWQVWPWERVAPDVAGSIPTVGLVVDDQGTLWFGGDQYTIYDQDERGARTLISFDGERLISHDELGPIKHIAADPEGHLWVAGYDGLTVIDPETYLGGR